MTLPPLWWLPEISLGLGFVLELTRLRQLASARTHSLTAELLQETGSKDMLAFLETAMIASARCTPFVYSMADGEG
jgi:hypothetical protein